VTFGAQIAQMNFKKNYANVRPKLLKDYPDWQDQYLRNSFQNESA